MEERLQLEESSRDQAEEDIKGQVCSSRALLQVRGEGQEWTESTACWLPRV